MILSMTGYGKAITQLPNKKITVEIKSLNSKNLDINARIPSFYREKELSMRNTISKALIRGKVDFSVYVELTGEETSASVNQAVVKQYMRQLGEIHSASDLELLKMAVRMPDALRTEREEIDDTEYAAITDAIQQAIAAIQDYRENEGRDLEQDLNLRINNISELLTKVEAIDPERVEAVKEKLEKAVSDLKEQVDQNRFEQELIYYLEKYDITEEVVRLKSHLAYFLETMKGKHSNGKKLGFISQEMGREINTMGSKSNYAPMQQVVVQMKDELEKIKEQSLNIM